MTGTFSLKAEVFFRENKGQVKDQNQKARPDILFSYDSANFQVHFGKNGLHYQLYRVLQKKNKTARSGEPVETGVYRVDINWLGSNKNVLVEKGQVLPGYENYYNGPDGASPILQVRRYNSLRYRNIYPGIDLHFFEGIQGGLKYDFIVQPGADYRNIQLEIRGAEISISSDQELIIRTPFGQIREGRLLVTQEGKEIASGWSVRDNVVSFRITGDYDTSKPLCIDPPVRLWGTYYPGSNFSGFVSCVEDNAGNAIACGDALDNNMATSGAFSTTLIGNGSILAKFNTSGQRTWATYYTGAAVSCGTDASNNVYLIGSTLDASKAGTPGTFQPVNGGDNDVYIAKFDASGARIWGTYFGGNRAERCIRGRVDPSGNIYLCGEIAYYTPVVGGTGAQQPSPGGGLGQDAFIAKFSTSGQKLWSTYCGGNQDDRPADVSYDLNGNTFLCGTTSSTGMATPGSHSPTLNTQGDAFLVKYNTSGMRIWATYYGGTNYDYASSCDTDNDGNVYLLGRTNSSSLIATVGTHQSNFAGSYDAFVVKFDPSGVRQWGSYYGGTGNEEPEYLDVSPSGDILITGETVSPSLIAIPGSHQPTIGGDSDAFLALFKNNGSRIWGTYYGGNQFEQGQGCTIGGSGYYYVCGITSSASGIGSTGTYKPSYNGTICGFLAKFEGGCTPPAAPTLAPASICGGQTATLNATAPSGVTFKWYNSASGGTAFFTGNSYTTPALNSNTTYYVEAQAGSCFSSRTAVTVTVTPAPAAPVAEAINPGICKGEAASFKVTSTGSLFRWYDAASGGNLLGTGTTFTSPALQAGATYYVERVENACSSPRAAVAVQVISVPDPTPADQQICSGTTASISSNVSGGATVQWYTTASGGTPIFSGSTFTTPILNSNTIYYAEAQIGSCKSARVPVQVSVVSAPVAPTVAPASICGGQTATLNATAPSGVTFKWYNSASGGTAFFTGNSYTTPALNSNTTYYVEAQAGSCFSSRTAVTVTVTPAPVVNIQSNSPLCEGSRLELTASSGGTASYSWSGPGGFSSTQQNPQIQQISPAQAGTYTLTVTANGCSTSRTVQVVVDPLPVANASYNAPLCEGNELHLSADAVPGASYNWTGPAGFTSDQQNPVINPVALNHAGSYQLTVTSSRNCSRSVSITVQVNAAVNMNIQIQPAAAEICAGDSVVLTASGADSYQWADGLGMGASKIVKPSTTRDYQLTAINTATGCTQAATVSVSVNPLPEIRITASESTLCGQGTVTLRASGGRSYQWSNGETTGTISVSPTQTTTYTVTGTDDRQCRASASTEIRVLQETVPQFQSGHEMILCYGATAPELALQSLNGISGTWQPAVMNNKQDGVYTFTPDAGQCATSYTLRVKVQHISIRAWPDTTVDQGNYVDLGSSVQGSSSGSYSWLPAANLSCADCPAPRLYALQNQVYSVTYRDEASGCEAEAKVKIDVKYDFSTICYVPNAFTPNGDGDNDYFQVYGSKIVEVEMRIFNRWGELIFYEKGPSPRWDGTYQGRLVMQDTYVYQVNLKYLNDLKRRLTGRIMMINYE